MEAVGDGEGEGVNVGNGVDVGVGGGGGLGAGVALSLAAEDIGDACAAGEISFRGDGVLVGVADFAAFDGVGVGDLRVPDGEDFGFGVGVGLGGAVCALRSTPM